MKSLPFFITQKLVQAAKIHAIAELTTSDGHRIRFTDPDVVPVDVPKGWVANRGAKVGGYLVMYQDNYLSWAPAEVFEGSSTPLEGYGLPVGQEPKYTTGPHGRLMNRTTEQAIPDQEPIFVLRAKDKHAACTVAFYLGKLPEDTPQHTEVEQRVEAFMQFAQANQQRMRTPS